MVTLKELERKRINKIKSLSDDELDKYLDVIFTDLVNILDVDTVAGVDDPNIFNGDIDNLYSKLDEIRDLLGDDFRINDIIKTKAINYESASHIGTKIKYSAKSVELKVLMIRLVFREILINIAHLKHMLRDYYDITVDVIALYDTVSSDTSADTVSAIGRVKDNYSESFYLAISDLVENITVDIETVDKIFYSKSALDKDIAEMKNTIKTINDSADERDLLYKRLGVLDTLVTMLKSYQEMQELKEFYDVRIADFNDLISPDNAFLVYSDESFNESAGDIPYDDFMKKEPKFNIKKCKLILP